MRPGDLVGDRFRIERFAEEGGMGAVYRARCIQSGDPVAIKVLLGAAPEDRVRFEREVRELSRMDHPAVVRYLAHGSLPSGKPYLAMEWLEGQSLGNRLQWGSISITETFALVRRVAGALAAAHARRVVHRDIKPGNLFLPDHRVEAVKLLDFGIARRALETLRATGEGELVGTPAYMAPEQARGQGDVGPAADVFSLGCVLFECLTGRPAFLGENVLAILAKILLDEVPRVSGLRKDVPSPLADLVARMLSKRAEDRPRDGAELLAQVEIAANGDALTRVRYSSHPPAAEISDREQRLVSVILVSSAAGARAPTADHGVTLPAPGFALPLEHLRAAASPFGARFEALLDGSAIAAVTGARGATDQVAQAARVALAMRAAAPGAPMVLATGQGVLSGARPLGEVIDRAAVLLRDEEWTARAEPAGGGPRPVRLDELTARLLDSSFDCEGDPPRLAGERPAPDMIRLLLGKPTPCVGREWELAALRALFDKCAREPAARAALVTGPAGIGKSRLRYELLRELNSAEPRAELWMARGDPMRAGSPFAMVAELIRRATGVADGEPPGERQRKIRARVAVRVSAEDVTRVTEFLSELIGAPLPGDDSIQLRAARTDPVLMGDQIRRAWEDFVMAESEERPVVIVLEDLHWGDLPSINLVDAALRLARERPVFVLALAHPDVHEVFPKLWALRRVQEIPLGELSRQASEELVRAALGASVSKETATRIAEQAAGNALYLEELIRAVAEGQRDAPPRTVLAMVQARLEALEPHARRLLRAASVFGQVAWTGGIRALLGSAQDVFGFDAWIAALVDREFLVRRRSSRFPGHEELTFRHALLQEGAYQMLTDDDHALGHRLAGEWLEHAGERDPMVLAEHFDRGMEPLRAAAYYKQAAAQALEGNDFEAVLTRGERAAACGAEGALLGEIRRLQAEAHLWRNEPAGAAERAGEATRLLDAGSSLWFNAAAITAWAAHCEGDPRALAAAIRELTRSVERGARPGAPLLVAIGWAARLALRVGMRPVAEGLFGYFAQADEALRREPLVEAQWFAASALLAALAGDLPSSRDAFETSAAAFELAGQLREGLGVRLDAAEIMMRLGDHATAEPALRRIRALADRMALPLAVAAADTLLASAAAARGDLSEARALIQGAAAAYAERGAGLHTAYPRAKLALVLLRVGEGEAAEREAREAVEALGTRLPHCSNAHAILSLALLARGKGREALSAAEEATRLVKKLGASEDGDALVRLALAEALAAAGDPEDARQAIGAARERLLHAASKIRDPARQRFLSAVPENRRTLELAARAAESPRPPQVPSESP